MVAAGKPRCREGIALGLIAGLTGQLFGAISTNPWLYFALANLLALFGFMMLDVIAVPRASRPRRGGLAADSVSL